jgi:hypothetical protein
LGKQNWQRAIRPPGHGQKGVRVRKRCPGPENSGGNARNQQPGGSNPAENGHRHFDANSLVYFSRFANAAWSEQTKIMENISTRDKMVK